MAPQISVERDKIADFCKRNHIRKLSFFGSVLRDDFGPESDVDVLVEFEPDARIDFFHLYDMEQELSGMLGDHKVEMVTRKALNHRLQDRILASAEVQYAEG